jgi:hypothetical protein
MTRYDDQADRPTRSDTTQDGQPIRMGDPSPTLLDALRTDGPYCTARRPALTQPPAPPATRGPHHPATGAHRERRPHEQDDLPLGTVRDGPGRPAPPDAEDDMANTAEPTARKPDMVADPRLTAGVGVSGRAHAEADTALRAASTRRPRTEGQRVRPCQAEAKSK